MVLRRLRVLENYIRSRSAYTLLALSLINSPLFRYFTTLIDLKTTHGEIADYFGSAIPIDESISPRKVISYQVSG